MKKNTLDYNTLVISLVSKLSRTIATMAERLLEPIDISLQEFRIVGLLIGETHTNQKDLAQKLSVKPSSLSVAISRLEEKGTLERTVSSTDKRVNYLTLNPDLDLAKMNNLVISMEDDLLKGISKKDLVITKRALLKMIENLEHPPQNT